ncbi:MAG: TonB-dependent receptor, partial [Gammaproteobacteria bacterium]|nr:TonB-dependent receptor [Gammaproteobacteria bacterium]
MQKIILFLSLVVLTSTIAAQQSDDALENILVTASRTPVPASRVGSSYTVISREDLERRQIVYVTDALRDVPGFSISR